MNGYWVLMAMSQAVLKNISETNEDPVRVIGTVKWFDSVKGFGFIVPNSSSSDALSGDVMVHVSVLRKFGESSATEGANIVCDAVRGPKGWQAVNILEMDRSRIQERSSIGSEDFEPVMVKWFDRAKGYGFVRKAELDADVFVHAVVAREGGVERLEPGVRFLAVLENGSKGWFVASAKVIDE